MFQKNLQLITWKKSGLNGYVYEFSVDCNILILLILLIFINIQWSKMHARK